MSVLTLAAISIDRYCVIFYPLKSKLQFKPFFHIMVAIWILSISISSFNLINYKIRTYMSHSNTEFNVCDLADTLMFRYYLLVETVVQFVIPLLLIGFSAISLKIHFPHNVQFSFLQKRNEKKKNV
jgi:hypothetical protein